MVVRFLAQPAAFDPERSRHPEMHEQGFARRQCRQQVFSAACHLDDGAAAQPIGEVRRERIAQVLAIQCDRCDARSTQDRLDLAADGFDFGKFGHRAIIALNGADDILRPRSRNPHVQTDSADCHRHHSRRPRKGPAVAAWFEQVAREQGKFEVEPIDLKAVNLPLLDEPEHPRLRRYKHEHTKAWSATVQRADAFVFVTPEYNFSMPPSLVNAVDYLVHEWNYKPVGFVSYGGVSGGLRARADDQADWSRP